MAERLEKKDFGYLGVDYQYKLAKCFVEDPKFFESISNIVEPAFFTEQLLRTFVGQIKDYYRKENIVPSYDIIRINLRAKASTDIEIQEIEALISKIEYKVTLEGYTVVEELADKFIRQQNYVKIAKKIIECAQQGDDRFDDIKKMWDDATLVGNTDEMGFSIFDIEDKALAPSSKVPIPTGISKLDEELNGGLEKKKIGIIIGSAGFGKTTFSTAIASYASTFRCPLNNNEGFKVLQIYFEDNNVDMARKHFSRIATMEEGHDVEAKDLSKTEQDVDEIKEVLANYPDRELMGKNLRLKKFLANTQTPADIQQFIKKLTNTGFKPDLVIIDYFECLAPERGGSASETDWKKEGRTIRAIENMADELDVAIWVPTQGNKGSFTQDLVTLDQAGGSVIKVQAAHVVISIARTLQDQDMNTATLAVLKNRSGRSGKIWRGIKFNNGTSTISCDDVIEFDNAKLWKEDEDKRDEHDKTQMIRELRGSGNTNSFKLVDNQLNSGATINNSQMNFVGKI